MNRTERLLDLIAYLVNAQEAVSWQEIKNHFPDDYSKGIEESNQRKFERDKAELISLGIPIEYQSRTEHMKGGYIIEKKKLFLPEIEFEPAESSLLMLAYDAVQESRSFPYRGQLESALHKIISVHRPIGPAPPEINIDYTTDEESKSGSSWTQQLQNALERRKWIDIEYHAFTTGETRNRRVNPYGLIRRRRHWTLVGWDHLRKAVRSFVLNRIQDLEVNSRRPGTPDYEIPASFSLTHYQNQQPWEFESHDPIPVTMEVSPHRLPELMHQLNHAECLDETTFRLEVTNREALISWVLSQKTDARVLDPPEIQQRLCRQLQALL